MKDNNPECTMSPYTYNKSKLKLILIKVSIVVMILTIKTNHTGDIKIIITNIVNEVIKIISKK